MDFAKLSRVNINLLVTLQALLKERSASMAAERLNLSQSSISKNLSQLRHTFKDPLFHRTAHGLTPTAFALSIEPKLSTAIEAIESLFTQNDFHLSEYKGAFRLSMQESAFEFITAKLLNNLLTQAPGIRLDTWFKDTLSLEHLNQGLLDFVILPHDVGQTPNLGNYLNSHELYRDHLVCLVKDNHPVLKEKWDQESYLNCRHIHVRDNELGTPIFDQTLARRGLERDIAVQVPDFHSASSLCSQSDLVFTTSSTWAAYSCKVRHLTELSMPLPSSDVVYSLIWHQRSESDKAHTWLKEQIIYAATNLVATA